MSEADKIAFGLAAAIFLFAVVYVYRDLIRALFILQSKAKSEPLVKSKGELTPREKVRGSEPILPPKATLRKNSEVVIPPLAPVKEYETIISEQLGRSDVEEPQPDKISAPSPPSIPQDVAKLEKEDASYIIKYAGQPQGNMLHRVRDTFAPYETFVVLSIDPANPDCAQIRLTDDRNTREYALMHFPLAEVCVLPEKSLPSSYMDIKQEHGLAKKEDEYWIITQKINLSWV